MKSKNMHRDLEFGQSPWSKGYVGFKQKSGKREQSRAKRKLERIE